MKEGEGREEFQFFLIDPHRPGTVEGCYRTVSKLGLYSLWKALLQNNHLVTILRSGGQGLRVVYFGGTGVASFIWGRTVVAILYRVKPEVSALQPCGRSRSDALHGPMQITTCLLWWGHMWMNFMDELLQKPVGIWRQYFSGLQKYKRKMTEQLYIVKINHL